MNFRWPNRRVQPQRFLLHQLNAALIVNKKSSHTTHNSREVNANSERDFDQLANSIKSCRISHSVEIQNLYQIQIPPTLLGESDAAKIHS
jgi:hypothetical protein